MTDKRIKSTKFYNIGQLRVQYWNNLKQDTAKLARCQKGSQEEIIHSTSAQELIKELRGVERFFAFPGIQRLDSFAGSMRRSEYMSLANQGAETTRQLVSDSYRSHPDISDEDQLIDEKEDWEHKENAIKNDFEVLFVEDMPEDEEKALKTRLRELRNPGEKFNYGIIIQRSFQDALIALQLNHNI